MANYHFELVYRLHPGEDPAAYLDALFEAGCDDASPSIGKPGYIGLTFDREADSALEAVETAVADAQTAIPHAHLERATPWLMNLTELAEEFGFTKQNLAKYQRGESSLGTFPSPFVAGKVSYWLVPEVADWLCEGDIIDLTKEQYTLYQAIWALNIIIEKQRSPVLEGFGGRLRSA